MPNGPSGGYLAHTMDTRRRLALAGAGYRMELVSGGPGAWPGTARGVGAVVAPLWQQPSRASPRVASDMLVDAWCDVVRICFAPGSHAS